MRPYKLSISDAHRKMRKHELTPIELLDSLLNRIKKLDPYVEAWITLKREEAEKKAESLTRESERGLFRGPLHGIPIGIKDIYYTKELKTTMGSPIFEDFIPEYDATVISKLWEAGAIVLGKTETTEFALTDPAPTRNPWNLEYTPGGSSSGSAAAVSAGMCPTALGSQTGGIVIRPASFCGVVGIKPTYDLISRKGVYPVSWSLDHVGVFTRTVEDASIVLNCLAKTRTEEGFKSEETIRLGIVREYFSENASEEVNKGYQSALGKIRDSGLNTEDFELPRNFSAIHPAHRVIMASEIASVHEGNYRTRPADYSDNIRGMITSGLLVPSTAYLKAQRIRDSFIREMYTNMKSYNCIVTPSAPTPALEGLESTGDPTFNSPWSLCGFPSLTLPSGLTRKGLPLGIQLVSPPYMEGELLRVAQVLEEVFSFPKEPREPSLPDFQ
ncbi:MAG: amidase [Candidatus Bathyarchaeia archaeon]